MTDQQLVKRIAYEQLKMMRIQLLEGGKRFIEVVNNGFNIVLIYTFPNGICQVLHDSADKLEMSFVQEQVEHWFRQTVDEWVEARSVGTLWMIGTINEDQKPL